MPNRVSFLVDGFNVYHSILEAIKDSQGTASLKWLDLASLCQSCLPMIGPDAVVDGIYYFSALATHLEAFNPGVTQDHRTYVDALRATGVTVELARFKRKSIWCPICKAPFARHEEKETDVAVASKLIELVATHASETVVLVTGDTDILPAIRTAKRIDPKVKICAAFPHRRFNEDLRKATDGAFRIKAARYGQHQLPDPVPLGGGGQAVKPSDW